MLLLDDLELKKEDFITNDGRFYYEMLAQLRKKGFYSLDEITILSNMNDGVIERYEACGGWEKTAFIMRKTIYIFFRLV